MGRGRQKAKQTKVARELKYFSPDTDYDALRRELANGDAPTTTARPDPETDTDEDDQDDQDGYTDRYADWSADGRR